MNIKLGNTELIHDNITRCEDIEDLKEVLHMNSRYYQEWKRFINDVVEVNSLSYEKLGNIYMSILLYFYIKVYQIHNFYSILLSVELIV